MPSSSVFELCSEPLVHEHPADGPTVLRHILCVRPRERHNTRDDSGSRLEPQRADEFLGIVSGDDAVQLAELRDRHCEPLHREEVHLRRQVRSELSVRVCRQWRSALSPSLQAAADCKVGIGGRVGSVRLVAHRSGRLRHDAALLERPVLGSGRLRVSGPLGLDAGPRAHRLPAHRSVYALPVVQFMHFYSI